MSEYLASKSYEDEKNMNKKHQSLSTFLCNAGKITFGNNVSQRNRTSVKRACLPSFVPFTRTLLFLRSTSLFISFLQKKILTQYAIGVRSGIFEEWQVVTTATKTEREKKIKHKYRIFLKTKLTLRGDRHVVRCATTTRLEWRRVH